jgi:YVTN family beta-propeller protein
VTIGIVLDDSVFFAGEHGSQAVVVDRSTWTVRSTPDLGRATGDLGTVEADADSIYVPTLDSNDVLVVDTSTFKVTDTIPTLGTRSVTVHDRSLWTTGYDGYMQRFDP